LFKPDSSAADILAAPKEVRGNKHSGGVRRRDIERVDQLSPLLHLMTSMSSELINPFQRIEPLK
jgi:hypothetical protein